MKNAIWILNSILLALFIFVGGFLYFSRQETPKRVRLVLEKAMIPVKQSSFVVNTAHIYENDLFGTYSPVSTTKEPLTPQLPDYPIAPSAVVVLPPSSSPPQFLEPLNVSLSGVFIDNDDSKSRAIIIDGKTLVQKMYSIGDMIEDAELLRIFENSVLFVRSNGQEETLFINQQAAHEDHDFNYNTSWDGVVLKQDDTLYTIDPLQFIKRIPHLSQFLEAIDATTVYKKGTAFGVRIGKIRPESVGVALGLRPGDIIAGVDAISTAHTQGRVEIYTRIRNMRQEGTISVEISRNGQLLTYTYVIKTLDSVKLPLLVPQKMAARVPINEKRLLAQSKVQFAPRIEQIHKKNKQAMMRRSGYKGITESLLS